MKLFHCCSSVAKSCLTLWPPWTAACQSSLSFTVSWSLLKLMYIYSVMLSNHLILCQPLFLLPSIFPSIMVFSNESAFWIKYQSIGASVSASVLPMNIQGWFPLGLTGLISWLPKETLKSLLQHHNSKASILWHSAFFMVQLSHPFMTTGNHSLEYMDLCQQSDVSAF